MTFGYKPWPGCNLTGLILVVMKEYSLYYLICSCVLCCIFSFLSVSCVSLLDTFYRYYLYINTVYHIHLFATRRNTYSLGYRAKHLPGVFTICINACLIDQIGTFKSPHVLIILQTVHTVNVAGSAPMNKPVNRIFHLPLWLIVDDRFWYRRKVLISADVQTTSATNNYSVAWRII